VAAAATCPTCDEEMVITRIKPILFSTGREHFSLACRKCGSTKTLTIKST
jgi:transposase-like protein